MIHIDQLTKNYGSLCAVDHISLTVDNGEVLGFLGPNGAGKTTTMRMLTGFLAPSSGSIHIKDLNVAKQPLETKQLMGYLPESAPIYQDMLVYDYLSFGADIRQIAADKQLGRLRELADLCGLNGVMHKPIGELSKGYKQRVGLAHAMMNDPEILVLDEPTSGLDPNQIVEIREIIRQIGRQKTVILSTHILSEAEATRDRVAIINNGKIVADDTTRQITQAAGGETIINIALEGADWQAAQSLLQPIDGVTDLQPAPADGDQRLLRMQLRGRADVDLRRSIYLAIRETPWILMEFYQQSRTLETIFRELTMEN